MTHDERLAWARSATVEEWAAACATLVMGWHPRHPQEWRAPWVNASGVSVAGWTWEPSISIADAWEVHQRMGQGDLRDSYHVHLCIVIEARRHAKGQTCCYSLDLTPEDICLAALLSVEDGA